MLWTDEVLLEYYAEPRCFVDEIVPGTIIMYCNYLQLSVHLSTISNLLTSRSQFHLYSAFSPGGQYIMLTFSGKHDDVL